MLLLILRLVWNEAGVKTDETLFSDESKTFIPGLFCDGHDRGCVVDWLVLFGDDTDCEGLACCQSCYVYGLGAIDTDEACFLLSAYTTGYDEP